MAELYPAVISTALGDEPDELTIYGQGLAVLEEYFPEDRDKVFSGSFRCDDLVQQERLAELETGYYRGVALEDGERRMVVLEIVLTLKDDAANLFEFRSERLINYL